MNRSGSILVAAVMFVLAGCARTSLAPKAPVPRRPPPRPAARYNPLQTFAKLTLPQPVNAYRSGDGAPGPRYWQNRADYTIHARVDPGAKVLTGTETITYTNNSPDTLDCVWLRLEQNAYKSNSRRQFAIPVPPKYRGHTNGFEIDHISVEAHGHTTKADTLVSDTRMQVKLAAPLEPRGRLKLHVAYHFTIPGRFGGRMGWAPSKNGAIFDVAQWYPRMAVYDDLRGWDTLPYLANEFYLEYGDFDYYVTVPADYVVAGDGKLVNPAEVLTEKERARLKQAAASDKTVVIRAADDIAADTATGERTWHFRMTHTRDVAFSASHVFLWDAARIDLPDHNTALAESFYPVESAGHGAWGRSTEFIKDAVENFSRRWYPYPWPTAINIAGPTAGMEYPGMAFDGIKDKGKLLFEISAHEIGHSWFPMIVGFNERRDAWMDEGFNTFIDTYESKDFHHAEFGSKHDAEFAPGGGNPVEEIQKVLEDPQAPVIMTRADAIKEKYRHPVTYFKTALGLKLLREQILGPARFDFAFRKFIRDWAFKHPSPSDFFRAMNSAGGEDLSWFWRGWFFHNWDVDLAVKRVDYVGGEPKRGAAVTIANLDRLVMPATVQVTYQDGRKTRVRLPADAWIQRKTLTLRLDGGGPIASVAIDPDHVIPDADRSNNVLTGPFGARPPKPVASQPPGS